MPDTLSAHQVLPFDPLQLNLNLVGQWIEDATGIQSFTMYVPGQWACGTANSSLTVWLCPPSARTMSVSISSRDRQEASSRLSRSETKTRPVKTSFQGCARWFKTTVQFKDAQGGLRLLNTAQMGFRLLTSWSNAKGGLDCWPLHKGV